MITTLPELILAGFFIFMGLTVLFAFIYSLFEQFAMTKMRYPTYIKGFKILDFDDSNNFMKRKRMQLNEIYNLTSGKFKFINEGKCIFRDKFYLLKMYTPFPLKGLMTIDDKRVHIEGRQPIGTTIFFITWFAGWTILSILMGVLKKSIVFSLFPLSVGWILILAMYLFCVNIEKKRLLAVYEEIKDFCQQRSAGSL
jgi:hypothetical protein